MYNSINFYLCIEFPANQTARMKPLDAFTCPSDASFRRNFTVVDDAGNSLTNLASSNYVGSFGIGDPSDQRDRGEGVVFRNSRILLRDITDGTSRAKTDSDRHRRQQDGSAGATTHRVLESKRLTTFIAAFRRSTRSGQSG